MPSARITKTVCVASNRPMPHHTAHTKYHRGNSNSRNSAFILTNRTPLLGQWVKNAVEWRIRAADGMASRVTTGFDMSYSAGAMAMDHHMFDNVFVNPEAYKSFTETGTWPDKTMLVLEARKAEGKGSINQRGNFQGSEGMGLEVH